MKSKFGRLLLGITASLCTLIALATSASACFFFFYQPEEPAILRKQS
ncbi:MAG: cyclic lactone autoinducer peptide [Bacillota bacterium]|nr:cyclic lactone autoinducer peptide [Bacillota bacterium]